MSVESYDLVVIGGGPAGASGALAASLFGKRVALVDRQARLGGAGILTGTVPSKALRESALVIDGWRTRKLLGVEMTLAHDATVSDLTHHSESVRDIISADWEARARARDIRVIRGHAAFADPHSVRVATASGRDELLRGEYILVAPGSAPFRPSPFPFEHPRVHDSDEILEITVLPKKLAVVGAGVIGAEYACTFAAIGVEVHVVDGRESLLPFLDHDVSAAITKAMERRGVRFHWGEKVVGCTAPERGDVVLDLSSGRRLAVSDVLVAAGRSSNTAELNLGAAGLTPGDRGLLGVNSFLQTEVPHIYAAGDVIGPPALASTSMEQARVAICHAFCVLDKELEPLFPSGIYTIPEASMVGLTEQAAKEKDIATIVGRADYDKNARGRLTGDEDGFLKLVFRRDDLRLLGVHAVGEQATELVHIGLMALLTKGDANLFSRACFNYPTLGDLYKYAAYHAIVQRLGTAPSH